MPVTTLKTIDDVKISSIFPANDKQVAKVKKKIKVVQVIQGILNYEI